MSDHMNGYNGYRNSFWGDIGNAVGVSNGLAETASSIVIGFATKGPSTIEAATGVMPLVPWAMHGFPGLINMEGYTPIGGYEGMAEVAEGAEMASIGAMTASYGLYLVTLEGSLNVGLSVGAAMNSLWDMANSPNTPASGQGGCH